MPKSRTTQYPSRKLFTVRISLTLAPQCPNVLEIKIFPFIFPSLLCLTQGRRKHSKSGGHMHSGAPLPAKNGTMLTEKGHFTYAFAKKWGSTCPLRPLCPLRPRLLHRCPYLKVHSIYLLNSLHKQFPINSIHAIIQQEIS